MQVQYIEKYVPQDIALWWFGEFCLNIEQKCWDVYDDIKDIWLLGEWLASPFAFFAQQFWYLDYYVKGFLNFYCTARNWVHSYYYTFLNVVDLAADLIDFPDFMNSPFRWVLDRLETSYEHIREFLEAPGEFIKGWLDANFSVFWYLTNSPDWWFIELIRVFWSDAVDLFEDPRTWLLNHIAFHWPHAGWFLVGQRSWFIGLLDDFWPQAADFIEDPFGWFVRTLEAEAPVVYEIAVNPGGFVVERFYIYLYTHVAHYQKQFWLLAQRMLRTAWEGKY